MVRQVRAAADCVTEWLHDARREVPAAWRSVLSREAGRATWPQDSLH